MMPRFEVIECTNGRAAVFDHVTGCAAPFEDTPAASLREDMARAEDPITWALRFIYLPPPFFPAMGLKDPDHEPTP